MRKKREKRILTRAQREARSVRRHTLLAALVFFAVSLAVLTAFEAYRCSHEFIVNRYSIATAKVSAPVRILMISDLHGSEFGEGNCELVAKAAELEPDVILCVGDMVTHTDTEEKARIGLDFLEKMTELAPVYMSCGNHEVTYVEKHGYDLLHKITDMGVDLLELKYRDISPAGQSIRVAGTTEYCFNYGLMLQDYYRSPKYAFFKDFCDTDSFKILLCHRPTAYYLPDEAAAYEDWDCDLVLCGHTHGGLWQLPLIGSIYLPQQGFFPKMDKGMFDMGHADMIVGGGLGHEAVLFRLFNPCELVFIELVPETEGAEAAPDDQGGSHD